MTQRVKPFCGDVCETFLPEPPYRFQKLFIFSPLCRNGLYQLLVKIEKLSLEADTRHPSVAKHTSEPLDLAYKFCYRQINEGCQPGCITPGKTPAPFLIALVKIGEFLTASFAAITAASITLTSPGTA